MYYSSVKQNENSEMIQKWRTKPYEIIEYVNDLPKDIKILELGSERGFLTRHLKEQGFKEVIGSDFNKYNIQLAKKLNGVSLKYIDALDINFRDASFDLVISIELIEHLPDVSKHIKDVKRVLKPGGLYCFSTPNVCMEKLYNFVKNQKPDEFHISLQSFRSICKLLKENGFEVKFIKMRQFRESHISKMGKLGKLSNFVPIRYFPKIFQPTIYCVAKLENGNSVKNSKYRRSQ